MEGGRVGGKGEGRDVKGERRRNWVGNGGR